MQILTTQNSNVIYNGVEKTPTNESIQYLEEVDLTGFFIELDTQIYRLVYSDFTFNGLSYYDFNTFKNEYYNILGLSDENIEP